MPLDPLAAMLACASTSAVCLISAASKLRHLRAFRATVESYRLLPRAWCAPAALAIPLLEASAGAALLYGPSRHGAALALISLFLGFATALGINIARGRTHIECGCFRPGAAHLDGDAAHRIGWAHVVRAVVMACAVALALPHRASRPLVWLDGLSALGALLTAATSLAAIEQLIDNHMRMRSRRKP